MSTVRTRLEPVYVISVTAIRRWRFWGRLKSQPLVLAGTIGTSAEPLIAYKAQPRSIIRQCFLDSKPAKVKSSLFRASLSLQDAPVGQPLGTQPRSP